MGYSQLTAVYQAAVKLQRALEHTGLEGPDALAVIKDALERHAGECDPSLLKWRTSDGESIDVYTLGMRYEELRTELKNQKDWGPLWWWTLRLSTAGFWILAVLWFLGDHR